MAKYKVEMKQFQDLENEITVPKFQRRLVWSKKQKEEFIETLHNGYPFGSILIYKYDSDEETRSNKKYTLIDGLQRYSTILEFKKSPEEYMDFEKDIDNISKILVEEPEDYSRSTISKFEREISDSIIEMLSKNKRDPFYLYDLIESKSAKIGININKDKIREIAEIQSNIIDEVINYLDVSRIQIPTIFFTGNESELAVVFENLNKGGKKLSKFQVFAAQWSNTEIKLEKEEYSNRILDSVIDRYNRLNESREVEIEDFEESEMRNESRINLPEFCYGLGELILEEMPVFWNRQNEDLANTIGYSTIALVLDVPLKELHKIIDKKKIFLNSKFLENLVKAIIKEYNIINTYFSTYLRYPGKLKDKYESSIATNFQLLSYFSVLWMTKYEPIDIEKVAELKEFDLIKKSNYSRNYNLIKKNLIYNYLEDSFAGYWSGTGDNKVDKLKETEGARYRTGVSKDRLESTLLNWWSDRQLNPTIQFDGNSKSLLVIHSNLESNLYNEIEYELEHVIARSKIKDLYKKGDGIPGGSLGNMMFLEKGENRSIKEFSLYDILKESSILDEEFIRTREYPSKKEFDIIEKELSSKEYNFKETRKIIDRRGKNIINDLLIKLYKD